MLHQNIINLALANNISQSALANATKIRQSTISRILSKKTKFPRYQTLRKIDAYLTTLTPQFRGSTIADPRTILSKVIDKKNGTQAELSLLTGISQPTISKILSGQHSQPRYETMAKLISLR